MSVRRTRSVEVRTKGTDGDRRIKYIMDSIELVFTHPERDSDSVSIYVGSYIFGDTDGNPRFRDWEDDDVRQAASMYVTFMPEAKLERVYQGTRRMRKRLVEFEAFMLVERAAVREREAMIGGAA